MKRWARRNLPTVVFWTALLLLAVLVIKNVWPFAVIEIERFTVTHDAFDETAYQSCLLAEAYAEEEHETADMPSTYDQPEPTQEADSEPSGKGSIDCQDNDDWERLAIACYWECGGDACCDECRLRVCDVILNRVADPRYPDTIEDVLTQHGQYGMFSTHGIIWPERASNPGEAHAVDRAWEIAEAVLTGTHSDLYGQGYIFQANFPQGSDTDSMIYCEQCNMWYCKG